MDREDAANLWVFGYGSLCWHPGFQYGSSATGYIRNYARRFWQGSTTHRGVPGKPGRVATLVKEDGAVTWGVAYELTGEAALNYLNNREVSLGGYATEIVPFYPKGSNHVSIPVLLYIATPASPEWAGNAPLHEIADQILQSSGSSGHNVEYLLRLAEFIREWIPEGYDDHLQGLEFLVRHRIKDNNICLTTLLGETSSTARYYQPTVDPQEAARNARVELHHDGHHEVEERRNSFQFSATLPPKKLRCLNL